MCTIDSSEILLSLVFPHYESKSESRFENFFQNLKKETKLIEILDYSEIKIDRIAQGIDKRTSIVIKNIPRKIKSKKIKKKIQEFGNVNFFYNLRDFNSNYNVKTATIYVNYINYKSIIALYMALRKKLYFIDEIRIPIDIKYSNLQGKDDLYSFIANNSTKLDLVN